MEMSFLSRGTDNHLMVKIGYRREQIDRGNSYKISMLKENSLKGLLSPYLMEEDGVLYFSYNVSACYVLGRMLSSMKPDGAFLRLLIANIRDCMEEIKDYMLSENDLVIDPKYMMYDQNNKQLKLICIPGYNVNIRVQLINFVEYIMKIFDYRDKEGIGFLYRLYEDLNDDGVRIPDALDQSCATDLEVILKEENVDEYKIQRKSFAKLYTDIILFSVILGALVVKYLFFDGEQRDIFAFICILPVAAGVIAWRLLFSEDEDEEVNTEIIL